MSGLHAAGAEPSDPTRERSSAPLEQQQESAQYARSLIEASLDPFFTVSAEGEITDVNEATVAVTGLSRQQLVGIDFSDCFTEPEKAREGYRQAFAEGYVKDWPLTLRAQDGRLTEVLCNAAVYRDARGRALGVFAAARDVTQLRRAELEVKRLNADLEQRVIERTAQLEAANRELEAFSYSVSHDLRAPLRHVLGFVELLERRATTLDEQSLRHLRTIAEAARGMGTLINDLLSFSRMRRLEMSRAPVDLRALVAEARRELASAAAGREISWCVGELPVVVGDRDMLRLVVTNLLSNALKFTSTRPRARIEVGAQEEEGQVVVFVRDDGVGFDMRYADKLFRVFQRLHRKEEFDGTGVGLANVRRIVDRHGGKTWAEGAVGGGATFYFSLPLSRGGGAS